MTTEEKLSRLFALLLAAASKDKKLLEEIEAVLSTTAIHSDEVRGEAPAATHVGAGSAVSSTGSIGPLFPRPKNRRKEAAFDPFAAYEESPAVLRERLDSLDLEQLRDVVAEFGMDPSKLVIKWKSTERVVEHIAATVEARFRKGDAFRR